MILQIFFVRAELGNLLICLFIHSSTFWEHKRHIQPKTGPKLIWTLLKVLKYDGQSICKKWKTFYHPRLVHQALDHPPQDVLDLCIQNILLHIQHFVANCFNALKLLIQGIKNGLKWLTVDGPTLFEIFDMIFPPRPFRSIFALSLEKSTWMKEDHIFSWSLFLFPYLKVSNLDPWISLSEYWHSFNNNCQHYLGMEGKLNGSGPQLNNRIWSLCLP